LLYVSVVLCRFDNDSFEVTTDGGIVLLRNRTFSFLSWQKLEDEERKLGFSLNDVAINDTRFPILCEI
jgi:hypothetical protein